MPIIPDKSMPLVEREQRAHTRRRQCREDRERVDETFIEHSEDDVDDDRAAAIKAGSLASDV
jgi:hypothetical protein